MASKPIELEGTWEEILAHADELAGQRVRVTVLPPEPKAAAPNQSPESQEMVQRWEEWWNTPLTDDERAVLDEFEQFRRDHPFRLRPLKDPD
jgi:hypothetical protein